MRKTLTPCCSDIWGFSCSATPMDGVSDVSAFGAQKKPLPGGTNDRALPIGIFVLICCARARIPVGGQPHALRLVRLLRLRADSRLRIGKGRPAGTRRTRNGGRAEGGGTL